MELNQLAQIVEDMAVQHDYPGFEVRSLKMGLPAEAVRSPGKLFNSALKHPNALVKLAGLRWFQEKPGVAKQFVRSIADCLGDADEWVRAEAALTLERLGKADTAAIIRIAELLKDDNAMVRKYAAKALGKLGCREGSVVDALQKATEDSDHEVRWKAQKALRQLGAYVA
jgi:vesicle coat complex subunit